MMSPSVFPAVVPGQPYPAPQYVSQPTSWQAPTSVRPAPPPAPMAAPAAPRPLVARAKGPDESPPTPAPAPLTMPSPEQLGVARARPAATDGVDWTATRRRLDRLGATCFHLEKLSPQGYRFTCLLPTTQPGRTHHVEAVATTEAEAVRLTLEKSEEWAGGR